MDYIKNRNIMDKYITKPKETLQQIIHKINNTNSWNSTSVKSILDSLYELKRLNFENKNTKEIEKINIYTEYMNHQLNVLNHLRNQLITLITTIFLPLGFIVGFFGMNFKSMGAPTLKKGILNFKHAHITIFILSILSIIVGISFFFIY